MSSTPLTDDELLAILRKEEQAAAHYQWSALNKSREDASHLVSWSSEITAAAHAAKTPARRVIRGTSSNPFPASPGTRRNIPPKGSPEGAWARSLLHS